MNFYSLDDVSKQLKVSKHTVKNWYRWSCSHYNRDLYKLDFPVPIRDEKGRMSFYMDDLDKILNFKSKLKYGMMSEFNKRYKK